MKSKRQILVIIVGVVLIFAIPIIINYLILQPKQFPFVGEGVDWLMFWGSYLGAAISAAIAFIILHRHHHIQYVKRAQPRLCPK